jgi:hypothetical protein
MGALILTILMMVVWPGQSPPPRNQGRLPDVIQRLDQRLDRGRRNENLRQDNLRHLQDRLDRQQRDNRLQIEQIQKDLRDRLEERRRDIYRR